MAQKWHRLNRFSWLSGSISFLVIFGLLIYFLTLQKDQELTKFNRNLEQEAILIEDELEEKMYLNFYMAKGLASYVSFNPSIKQDAFQDYARKIYNSYRRDIRAIQLVKDSIISFNYPTEGNEEATGLNILTVSNDRKRVEKAMQNKEAMVIGPRTLVQGILGVVYREPIILDKNNDLWGYSVIVVDLEEVFERYPLFENLSGSLALYRDSISSQTLFYGDNSILQTPHIIRTIDIPMGEWQLVVSDEEGRAELLSDYKLFIAVFFILSLIIGLLTALAVDRIFNVYRTNNLLKSQNLIIRKQLHEKEIFISEIHHRIKNHFQLFSSLNRVKYMEIDDPKVREVLEEIDSRLHSLSQAYGQLRESKSGNKISLKEYIITLSNNLIRNANRTIRLELNMNDVSMEIKKVVQIGVIVNEWLINSFKYAFTEEEKPLIKLSLQKVNNKYQLEYLDNGGKLPRSILEGDHNSSGIELILMFTEQLDAKLEAIYLDHGLNGFRLTFSE